VRDRKSAIEAASRHCDLAERLTLVPPSATVRGLYANSVQTVLDAAGRGEAYRAIFPERCTNVGTVPVAELLVRVVVGGAMLTSPETVHEGMFEIGRRNAVVFSESLIGRTMIRLLSKDPSRLLQQAVAGRRLSAEHARWSLALGEQRAVISMREEYLYIESYMLGAAQGTFDAIGRPVRTRVELDSAFVGRHILEW
jgi:uncharacterized protein (TIGR02265 family)